MALKRRLILLLVWPVVSLALSGMPGCGQGEQTQPPPSSPPAAQPAAPPAAPAAGVPSPPPAGAPPFGGGLPGPGGPPIGLGPPGTGGAPVDAGFKIKAPPMAVFPALAAGHYRLDQQVLSWDPGFREMLQSGPISLQATDASYENAIKEIARQSERQIRWEGMGKNLPPLSLSLQEAPFWVALLAVCERAEAGLEMFAQSGHPIVLAPAPSRKRIWAWQVSGPFLFAWHGFFEQKMTVMEKDGSETQRVDQTVECHLFADPESEARVFQPRADPEFTCTFADGRTVKVKADQEVQDGMGGRIWKWPPRPEWTNAKADVGFALEVLGIRGMRTCLLPCRTTASTADGGTSFVMDSVKLEPKEDRDPQDPFKTLKILECAVRFRLTPSAYEFHRKIEQEKRQPTKEEWSALQKLMQADGPGACRVHLTGVDGRAVRGKLSGTSQVSGPCYAYSYEVVFKTPDLTFKPQDLRIVFGGSSKPQILQVKVQGAPLGKP